MLRLIQSRRVRLSARVPCARSRNAVLARLGLDQEGDCAASRPRRDDARTFERFLIGRSKCWTTVGARQVDVHLAPLDGAP